MNKKLEQLELLDTASERCMEENGTLRTHGVEYDYHIRKQIEQCDRMGATRVEIQAILSKYTHEMIIKVPTLRRKTDN